MAVTIYYEQDCNPDIIKDKKIAIIGYGSQGHAHALNLKDSGCDVRVGLREGSHSIEAAEEAGLRVTDMATAAEEADLIMVLVPDELQPEVYETYIAPHLKAGDTLAFAHGFNVHYGYITPPEDVNVIMCAPKGPGHIVRRQYTEGSGVPDLICVAQDATGDAWDIALSYAWGVGGARAGGGWTPGGGAAAPDDRLVPHAGACQHRADLQGREDRLLRPLRLCSTGHLGVCTRWRGVVRYDPGKSLTTFSHADIIKARGAAALAAAGNRPA